MKRIILLLLLFFLALPVFSNENKYYPGEKYKKEITKTIDKEYQKAIKAIDNVFIEFEKEKDPYKKEAIIDWGVPGVMFDFFDELIKQTNDYAFPPLPQLETDWNYALEMQIRPYLKKNKIDRSKIRLLRKYADNKQRKLERMRKEIIYPTSE